MGGSLCEDVPMTQACVVGPKPCGGLTEYECFYDDCNPPEPASAAPTAAPTAAGPRARRRLRRRAEQGLRPDAPARGDLGRRRTRLRRPPPALRPPLPRGRHRRHHRVRRLALLAADLLPPPPGRALRRGGVRRRGHHPRRRAAPWLPADARVKRGNTTRACLGVTVRVLQEPQHTHSTQEV